MKIKEAIAITAAEAALKDGLTLDMAAQVVRMTTDVAVPTDALKLAMERARLWRREWDEPGTIQAVDVDVDIDISQVVG